MSVARRLDELLQTRCIMRAQSLFTFAKDESPWSYGALQGRLVSLTPGAMTPGAMNAPFSALFQIIWDAQKEGETVAWIGGAHSCFYPPDVANLGVDVQAITVIRLHSDKDMWFAADTLIRSGGVGMVIIDLASIKEPQSTRGLSALQHRLSGLARTHNAAVLILPSSLSQIENSALISLAVHTQKTVLDVPLGACHLQVTPQKDKTGASVWQIKEVCDVPDGLR